MCRRLGNTSVVCPSLLKVFTQVWAALEIDIQPFGLRVQHRFRKDVDPLGHELTWMSLESLVNKSCHFFAASSISMALSCELSKCFTPAIIPSRVSLSSPVERQIWLTSKVSAYFWAEPVKRVITSFSVTRWNSTSRP